MDNSAFCLSQHLLMDIWAVNTLCLVVLLLWTLMYKPLCNYVFSCLVYMHRHRTAGSYGSSVTTFWVTAKFLPQRWHHFTFPHAMYEGSTFLIPFPSLVIFLFFLSHSHFSSCEVVFHDVQFFWTLIFLGIYIKFTQCASHFKVNNSVLFSTFTVLCNYNLYMALKHYHYPRAVGPPHPYPSSKESSLSSPSTPGRHESAFCLSGFTFSVYFI